MSDAHADRAVLPGDVPEPGPAAPQAFGVTAGSGASGQAGSRRLVRGLAGAIAVVAALWAVGGLLGGPGADPADPADGRQDATGAGDGTRAPLRVGPVAAMVGPDGRRVPLPEDFAGWLAADPRIRVIAVRPLRGGGWGSGGFDSWQGVRAVNVDYELAAGALRSDGLVPDPLLSPASPAGQLRRVFGVPLLCVGTGPDAPCTRLLPGVRVRTTLVFGVDGTTSAVETRWTPSTGSDSLGRMPEELRGPHRQAVVDEVTKAARTGAEA